MATIRNTVGIENAIRCIQDARDELALQFDLGHDSTDYTIPRWVLPTLTKLEAASGHLKNTLRLDISEAD